MLIFVPNFYWNQIGKNVQLSHHSLYVVKYLAMLRGAILVHDPYRISKTSHESNLLNHSKIKQNILLFHIYFLYKKAEAALWPQEISLRKKYFKI